MVGCKQPTLRLQNHREFMLRLLGRSLILLGVAVLSSCTTGLWIWAETWTIPPVPLTSDLPREITAKSATFDARVKARFPIGTPMADVGPELARENFLRQDWTSLANGEHRAKRYDGGAPVCNDEAWISWKSDENDRLTAITGEYFVTCL